MALQWLWAGRLGIRLLPERPDLKNPDLRTALALFLPYAAGLSLNQINPVISRMLASFLEGGVISALNYADRIIQLPLGLFVIAISQAVLPMLSRLDSGDVGEFRIFIRDALRFNLFVVLPAAIGLIVIARPIVHVLLMRGAFGDWAWIATSGALACYAAGLPGIACNTVLMRALYARAMPRAAISVTLFTVCANLISGVLLMRFFSYRGLAMGTSIAFTGAAVLASCLLARNLGVSIGLVHPAWLARIAVSCSVMTGGLMVLTSAAPYPADVGFLPRFTWVCAVVILGALLYTISTLLLRCPEWAWVREALAGRGKKGEKGGAAQDE
jgi:putative peptidoglycan lipid II flippase